MVCPKCDEGRLEKILFKKDKSVGFLCDFCGNVWLEGESIQSSTGHIIESLTKNNGREYAIADSDEKDGESKSVMYPKVK